MKHLIFILFTIVSLVASSQVESETYFGKCGMIIVNDFENTPYLDTLLYHYNYDMDYIMEFEVVNIMNVEDFTCVKGYEITHGENPVIDFKKPNINCYDVGWSKVSLLHVGLVDDSCGVSTTTLFMIP